MDHVMSANNSPPPPPHRIAIIMSPEGRFLQCRDCHLTLSFPDGAQYVTVVLQFESHLCSSARSITSSV
jgi:hypothetical protein